MAEIFTEASENQSIRQTTTTAADNRGCLTLTYTFPRTFGLEYLKTQSGINVRKPNVHQHSIIEVTQANKSHGYKY